ncbi:adenylate/guanylate cyclase domain-containing protein [Acidiferrimicrobium sp. IK]|uniref:adenylate/guanylate cyclase domain-containing protein n=1 Tax=Acidiferrimicrobium sp. IK TaxID=2871700 RepID=UPI0021CB27D9|nr:adenylate/guanylate cyclase domain-containing protein [Acidiferrimicrobium sp. IK]MCU4183224.1 adenylate/guanylate cyclase domain-containing protein [Acidiferrimicrobium sp. IK]
MERSAVGRARDTGVEAVGVLRRLLARRTAELIRSDPDAAAAALEMGLVDARWLEDPTGHPNVTSPPGEVLERFLQRTVDARPSRLGTLGLGAVQLLSSLTTAKEGATLETTAVVFTDLEGFTAYTDRHGDQAALELLTDHQRRAGTAVRRNGGRIVKRIGDGLMCAFPDANAAVRAALDLVATAPDPLRVRAGGHIGEAVATRDDLIGHAVNLAARVTETAEGGQVLVTAEMVAAAGPVPQVAYRPGRARRLKGISEKVTLHEVVADPARRGV